jgi:hypothetical protein
MPLYVVDTILPIRIRYVVEAKEATHADDEVTMIDCGDPEDAFEPFSQKPLISSIIETREITKAEYRKMLKEIEQNGEGSYWMGEKLIRKINYVE